MAETYWTERSGDDDVPYSGSEVYMDFKKCLIRSRKSPYAEKLLQIV